MATKKRSLKKNLSSAKQSQRQTRRQETCFIIMPFGDWFDYYYETIYRPAIQSTGLIPRRADDLFRPSAIVNDIWALTQQAKIILADLTGKNANVFYELGLAHAVAKPAILVAESMDDIPFDLRSLRILVYDKNEPNWGGILRQRIETAINEVLATPLEAVLPTFLKIKESTSKRAITKEQKQLLSMKQDIELLKRDLQMRTMLASPLAKPFGNTEEATEYVRSHLKQNAPESFVLRRLEERGIARSLAHKLISSVQVEMNKESHQSLPPTFSETEVQEN